MMVLRTPHVLGAHHLLRGGTPHLRPLDSSSVLREKKLLRDRPTEDLRWPYNSE